jgi:uncharacterized protein (TIGR00369 family)
MKLDQLQAGLDISPFQCWLGLQARAVFEDGIELHVPWRKELVSNPAIQSTHGGILASLIDLSGLFAILACGGSVSATADLHVDYHKPATPGVLVVRSTVTKIGRRASTANTRILDTSENLLASGRGLYLAGS